MIFIERADADRELAFRVSRTASAGVRIGQRELDAERDVHGASLWEFHAKTQ